MPECPNTSTTDARSLNTSPSKLPVKVPDSPILKVQQDIPKFKNAESNCSLQTYTRADTSHLNAAPMPQTMILEEMAKRMNIYEYALESIGQSANLDLLSADRHAMQSSIDRLRHMLQDSRSRQPMAHQADISQDSSMLRDYLINRINTSMAVLDSVNHSDQAISDIGIDFKKIKDVNALLSKLDS